MATQTPILSQSSRDLAEKLRARLQRFESTRPLRGIQPISSGCTALDKLLPNGGFARGSFVECLGEPGEGAGTLGLILARQAAREGGDIAVLDSCGWFYPPAAASLGLDLRQLLVIRPKNDSDLRWTLDQALRCPAIAAVWADVERLEPHHFRRLALSAEQGGGLGILVRPTMAGGQPSWSEIQLRVHAVPSGSETLQTGRRLRVEIARCRQGPQGGVTDLELDELIGVLHPTGTHYETHPVHLAADLAHSASGSRSARA